MNRKGKNEDILIWPFNRNEAYIMKSGYQVLKDERKIEGGNGASSSHIVDGKIWKIIWSMKIPSKVKVFIWKLCVDAIPCFYELWKRKIKNSSDCPVRGREPETIEHILFLCEWTKGVWFSACSGLRLDRNTMTRFDVWLQKVVGGLRGNKDCLGLSGLWAKVRSWDWVV